MKNKILTLALLIAGTLYLGAQNWETAFTPSSSYNQWGIGTARDVNDNRIVVGAYETSTAVFSPTLSLVNSGGRDGYVVKYNPSNAPIWGARINGSSSSNAKSVTTDESGNVYVSGNFSGYCEFRHGNSTGTGAVYATFNIGTGWDGFVVKYNSSGTIQWVNRIAISSSVDEIANIAYRNSMLVVLGSVNANTSVSGFPLVQGPYLAKVNPATGITQWAYNCPSGGGSALMAVCQKQGLCIDNGGNIYINVTANNGGVVQSSGSSYTVVTNAGAALYAKYNSLGSLIWARNTATSASGTHVIGSSIVADDLGNVYVAGRISTGGNHTVYFPAPGTSMTINVTMGDNAFLGKVDPSSGLMQWVRPQVGISQLDLAVQSCGLLYAVMNAWPGCVINGTGGTSLSPNAQRAHIVKFASNGQLLSTLSNEWRIDANGDMPYLNSWKNSIDFVGNLINTSTFPLTAGGSVTLTPVGWDMLAATIKDQNPFAAPSISLSASPMQICAGNPTTLNAIITGSGGPFTITWNVYTGSSWIPYPGSINSTTLPLTGTDYAPYVHYNAVLNSNICAFQIVVTNCNGNSYTATTFFIVYTPITYGMTTEQTVCLNDLNPQAIFNVSAPNAWAFSWEVSCDGGVNWSDLTGVSGYSGQDSPTLTVTNVTLAHDGCQYRCVLEGNFCSDVTTNPATLEVIATCRLANPEGDDEEATIENTTTPITIYPNPTSDHLTISGIEGTAEVSVISVDGRVVLKNQSTNSTTTIDVSQLSRGTYMIQVLDQSGVRTERFIKN
jgi:hypothetical protein